MAIPDENTEMGTEDPATPVLFSSLAERLFKSDKKRKASFPLAKDAFPPPYDEITALRVVKVALRRVFEGIRKRVKDRKLTKKLKNLVGLFQAFSDIYMPREGGHRPVVRPSLATTDAGTNMTLVRV